MADFHTFAKTMKKECVGFPQTMNNEKRMRRFSSNNKRPKKKTYIYSDSRELIGGSLNLNIYSDSVSGGVFTYRWH